MATARIPALIALRNPVVHSDWGSHTHLAELRGLARSSRPEAELWISAHPKAPSVALLPDGEITLDELLRLHAHDILDERSAPDFPGGLPFLLKLLAIEQPLSIQIHPDAAQALEGWLSEEARGIAVADPCRTFVDRAAKPELFAALKPSVVLCGFRPTAAVVADLRAVGLAWLEQTAPSTQPGDLFTQWMHRAETDALAAAVEAAIHGRVDASIGQLIAHLAELHPDDPAALSPLFMHIVELDEGDALAIEPGIVHAAVRGFGVEVMASSDNVVRAGLTSKHTALDVFSRLVRTAPYEPTRLRADGDVRGWFQYPTSHVEFELSSATLANTAIDVDGFAALLCVKGALHVESEEASLSLSAGEGCLVRTGCTARISGAGQVFACRVPVAP